MGIKKSPNGTTFVSDGDFAFSFWSAPVAIKRAASNQYNRFNVLKFWVFSDRYFSTFCFSYAKKLYLLSCVAHIRQLFFKLDTRSEKHSQALNIRSAHVVRTLVSYRTE